MESTAQDTFYAGQIVIVDVKDAGQIVIAGTKGTGEIAGLLPHRKRSSGKPINTKARVVMVNNRVEATQNTPVVYHGSLAAYHGPARQIAECRCVECCADQLAWDGVEFPDVRWVLALPDGSALEHVRPESFTLAESK